MLILRAMTILRQGCWLTITISPKSTSGIRSYKEQRMNHLQVQNISFTWRLKSSGMLHQFLHILILESGNCKVFLSFLVSKCKKHAENEVMQLEQNWFLPSPGEGCLSMDISNTEQHFDNDRYLRKVGVPGEI